MKPRTDIPSPLPLVGNFRYRPEIDGLRAVAVLVVVLYHAGFGCSGGFVGVDVFFVISGFLITSLIWKELEAGCFSFATFWERRARRILPALIVVTFVVLGTGWFLLLPGKLESLGRATVFQSVFAANIHYWQNSGYFADAADENPLLHTWSLAVEEQFYFVVPVLLWGMFRIRKLRSRAGVLRLLGALFAASLALSISGANARETSAFYLLPARAWELLLGSLVAFLPAPAGLTGHRKLRETLSLAGLALILVPVFMYTSATPFPGLAALPPCLGAALLIWTNGGAPTSVGLLLSARPVVYVGLISYSLYLWHWPFFAFAAQLLLAPASVGQRAAMVCAGLLLAVVSYRYVETPFRKRRIGRSRAALFAWAGAGALAVLGCGLLLWTRDGFPGRISPQARNYAKARSEMSFIRELTLNEVRSGKLVPLGVRDPALRPTVLVWGDSHAMAALPAVDAFLKEKGLAGRAATHSSTLPVLDWYAMGKDGLGEKAIPFNDAVLAYVAEHKIPIVILSARWGSYLAGNEDRRASFNTALLTTVQRLLAVGSRPFVLLDVPNQPFHVPNVLAHPAYSHAYILSQCARPTEQNRFDLIDPGTIAAIEAAGGRIIDPKPRFLDPTGRHYIVQADGIALYRDRHHLTTRGAKLMLLPLFRLTLIPVTGTPRGDGLHMTARRPTTRCLSGGVVRVGRSHGRIPTHSPPSLTSRTPSIQRYPLS